MRILFGLIGIVLLTGGLFPNASWAGACLGDSLQYRFFPEEIGHFNSPSRVTVELPCDTMIVETGKMTTLYSNTLLHFGKRVSENCVIQVRGQLFAKAGRTSQIIFAGDIDSSEFGVVSGKGIWGGLFIDTLGSVYFQNVEVKNASTAMIFIGRNSKLEKVGFLGAYGLILPGGMNYTLNPKGTYFTSFDILAPPKSGIPTKKSPPVTLATLPALPPSPAQDTVPQKGGSSSWVWTSVAAGALIAGGAAAFAYWPESQPETAPIDNAAKPENFEELPSTPPEQKRPFR